MPPSAFPTSDWISSSKLSGPDGPSGGGMKAGLLRRPRGERVIEDLAADKRHAADATQQGRAWTNRPLNLLRVIEGVDGRIDGVHERLDREFERRATTMRS
jgi:hypothetical protein